MLDKALTVWFGATGALRPGKIAPVKHQVQKKKKKDSVAFITRLNGIQK